MRHVRSVLSASVRVARCLEREACSVLTHCSDGWDRTPQMCATAELLLDPHFRTLRGFALLIEKEWCAYGHKFRDRCGHVQAEHDSDESPIFVLWVDCVAQIVRQFPDAFEFKEELLVALADQVRRRASALSAVRIPVPLTPPHAELTYLVNSRSTARASATSSRTLPRSAPSTALRSTPGACGLEWPTLSAWPCSGTRVTARWSTCCCRAATRSGSSFGHSTFSGTTRW